jgi:hypothetical protein
MSTFCQKLTITNNYKDVSTISYNRCGDNQYINEYQINVGETRIFWIIRDTFSSAQKPFLSIQSEDFPPFVTPTPTLTLTPSVTPAPE